MRSKTSKPNAKPPSLWKAERACSEHRLSAIAAELADVLGPGHRVLLEGPLGAGKSTFARALLLALGVNQPPEGSPTFALAHEYRAPIGPVAHVDFYRIRAEAEIEEAGLTALFWPAERLVIAEWASLWPGFLGAILHDRGEGISVWRIEFAVESEVLRGIRVELLS